MKSVIVSGGTGYIGINLVKRLKDEYHVYVVVRKSSKIDKLLEDIDEKHIIIMDVDLEEFYRKVQEIRPDYFVHLAGKFVTDHSDKNIEELLDSNYTVAVKMLDAVCKSGCKNIINTGSYWQNYDGKAYNPVNLYAAIKEAFENTIRYFTECMGCKCITLKLFDTYGPNDPRRKILNIINSMKEGEEIDMSSCEQKVFFCYIDDVIDAYINAIHMIKNEEAGSFVEYAVRDEKAVVLKDIVLKLKKATKKNITLNFGKRPMREREILEPDGIGVLMPGWKCKVSLDEGLKHLVNSME